MTEENTDEYWVDPLFWETNPLNTESMKDFFMRSKFADTPGINKDMIEIQVEKVNEDYYLIYKKKLDLNNVGKAIGVYYYMRGQLFPANNLKAILEAKINRINYFDDKINKLANEWMLEDEKNLQKNKRTIKLKKEFQ
jgi:hypothetical protein